MLRGPDLRLPCLDSGNGLAHEFVYRHPFMPLHLCLKIITKKFGLRARRSKLDNRYSRSFELHARAPRVGVKPNLCRAVHRRQPKRYEGQSGRDVHDERFGASLQEGRKA